MFGKNPINEKLIRQISEELDLPIKQVREIVGSQSKFTTEVMRSDMFDSVRWPYFGVFKAKVKHANVLNYMKGLNSAQRKFFSSQKHMTYKKKKSKKNKK